MDMFIKADDIFHVSGIGGETYSYSDGITIDRCSNGADILAISSSYLAGIVSSNNGVKMITNCVNAGNLTISHICYGAAGICTESMSSIYNCCNMGNIKAVRDTEFSNKSSISGIGHFLLRAGDNTIQHCLNYGELEGDEVGACLYDGASVGSRMKLINNFFLESSPLYYVHKEQNSFLNQDNKRCTQEELTSEKIISLLNSNLESGWCRWVKGKDGFPTLDYHAEVSGINYITTDGEYDGLDFNQPYEVYNIQGLMMSNDIDKIIPGVYIVRQGLKKKKILIQ